MIKTSFWDESYVKKKKPQDMGYFFRRPGKSVTRSLCLGIMETKDKISALTGRKMGSLPPPVGKPTPPPE
jgi:hypothetical protein